MHGFTARQAEVLKALLDGASNAEISKALHLRHGTVKAHVASIMNILDVRTRSEMYPVMADKFGQPRLSSFVEANNNEH